jgi:hypothetical protein
MPVLPWWIGKLVEDYEQLFLGTSFGPAIATEFVILAEDVTGWVLNSHSCFAFHEHGGGSAILSICHWRLKWYQKSSMWNGSFSTSPPLI